jgi:hypothetical protein
MIGVVAAACLLLFCVGAGAWVQNPPVTCPTAEGAQATADAAYLVTTNTPMRPVAWVSTNGVDATAIIGNPLHPYRSLHAAWTNGATLCFVGPGTIAGLTSTTAAVNLALVGDATIDAIAVNAPAGGAAGAVTLRGSGRDSIRIASLTATGETGTNGVTTGSGTVTVTVTNQPDVDEYWTVTGGLGGAVTGQAGTDFTIGATIAETITNWCTFANGTLPASVLTSNSFSISDTAGQQGQISYSGMNDWSPTDGSAETAGSAGGTGGAIGAITLSGVTVSNLTVTSGSGGDGAEGYQAGAGGSAGAIGAITATDARLGTTAVTGGNGGNGGASWNGAGNGGDAASGPDITLAHVIGGAALTVTAGTGGTGSNNGGDGNSGDATITDCVLGNLTWTVTEVSGATAGDFAVNGSIIGTFTVSEFDTGPASFHASRSSLSDVVLANVPGDIYAYGCVMAAYDVDAGAVGCVIAGVFVSGE